MMNESKKKTTQLLTTVAGTSYTSTIILCTGAKVIMAKLDAVVQEVNDPRIIHLNGVSSNYS